MSACYLNKEFLPQHGNHEFYDKHRVSEVACNLHDLLKTTLHAFQDDNSLVPLVRRGIDSVLKIAIHMSGDLTRACEGLEKANTKLSQK